MKTKAIKYLASDKFSRLLEVAAWSLIGLAAAFAMTVIFIIEPLLK